MEDEQSKLEANTARPKDFLDRVGVYQESALSPFLFFVVLDVLGRMILDA